MPSRAWSAARLWGPVAVWLAVIFAASAQGTGGAALPVPDWVSHGTEYLILSVLLCRALAGGLGYRVLAAHAIAVVLFCGVYGVSDEFHQSFVPGRDASAWDVGKDVGGATVGAALFRRLSRGARPGPGRPPEAG